MSAAHHAHLNSSPAEIDLLPAAAAADEPLVQTITELVNRVYTRAEDGLWVNGAARTTTVEMAALITGRQIAVTVLGGQIVGSVRIQQLDAEVGEFGMLVAHPDHRGVGVGRRLVSFAEQLSLERGLSRMQLELLVPRGWRHPTKMFLHKWYSRLGYRPASSGTIDQSYPHLAPLLATPCNFVVYHKELMA